MDLGSAPGGWSQVAGKLVGDKGRVLATDILPMDPVKNVDFIQGDFTEEAVFNQMLEQLDGQSPTSIISDIAPNISGIDSADQAPPCTWWNSHSTWLAECSSRKATSSQKYSRVQARRHI